VKIWGLTEGEIRECVKLSGLAIWSDWSGHGVTKNGNALSLRLCVDTTQPRTNGLLPFQKRARSLGGRQGRRLPYVTWEGHREFMLVVFERYPEARIKSAIADYKGREEFLAKHPQTKGLWNAPTY
jgi:hypothetical protein